MTCIARPEWREPRKLSAIAEQGAGMRHIRGDMAVESDEIYCGFHGMRPACRPMTQEEYSMRIPAIRVQPETGF